MAKILICDNEAGLRAVMKRYTQFEGYDVKETGDGLEAVDLCRKNDYDIIIFSAKGE